MVNSAGVGKDGSFKSNRNANSFKGSLIPEMDPSIKVSLKSLQHKFQTFSQSRESMASILNVKLIKQRFLDFQTKLKVWKQRERQRKRMKKHMKRNFERLNGFFEYAHQTFQDDTHLVVKSNDYYSEF